MAENTISVSLKARGSISQAVTGSPCEKKKKREKKMVQSEDAEGSCKANDHDCWRREGESSLRGAADVVGEGEEEEG